MHYGMSRVRPSVPAKSERDGDDAHVFESDLVIRQTRSYALTHGMRFAGVASATADVHKNHRRHQGRRLQAPIQ